MRAIWKGEITFGLVNVPVKLYGATRSHDVSLHQVHDKDHGRIRYERRCDVCGRQIDYEHIDKAYDDGDKTVVLSDDDFESIPESENDEIDVVQFVPDDQIDPILLGTAYYLEPVGRSAKSYTLLRRTLVDSDRTAVVRFTLRTKTRLGVLRHRDSLLMLQTLRWPQDLHDAGFSPKQSRVTSKELDMASALVEQFSGDFDPDQYTDEYQEELQRLIDTKLESDEAVDSEKTFGEESSDSESSSGSGQSGDRVVSLMDALERSVKRKREAEKSGESGKPDKSTSSKKSTKKSTA